MKERIAKQVFAVVLIGICLTPASISATEKRFGGLVGSWELTAVNDDTGAVSEALITYERGGTLIATGPTLSIGTAHGAWKRTGLRAFEATFVNFIYDSNGVITSKVINRHDIELDRDGSYSARFVAEIILLDGTVVDVLTSTVTGVRIEL